MNLPIALYTAEQTRQLDSLAIQRFAVPGYSLMSRAGEAIFSVISQYAPQILRAVVVCGVGNNAGDGYVVARLLHTRGYRVDVLQLGDAAKVTGDALLAKQAMEQSGVFARPFVSSELVGADVIVDAIFGTGLERDVAGAWADAIVAINESDALIVAADIPSGLHADTGTVMGVAVQANWTVTFIGLKLGMFTHHGVDYCGEIFFDDLQVPKEIYAAVDAVAQRLSWEQRPRLLPQRRRNVHKGSFGHVLAVGGEIGMPGAISLAAQAAMRVGAGIVTVATRQPHAVPLALACPVLMAKPVESSDDLTPLLQKATCVAIGPGLGMGEWGQQMLNVVLSTSLPMVIDADGLNLLATQKAAVHRSNWVLTPHPLEAARLLGCSAVDVQANRLAAVKQIAQRFGGVCLLKGAGTLISDGEKVILCDAGNGAMASAGMGDVLTGVIAGLLVQQDGDVRAEWVAQAALLHAHCADVLVEQGYGRIIASDLLTQLARQVKDI